MIQIQSIVRGIVIDHITVGRGWKIFNALNLQSVDYTTALIQNVHSNKLGKKDLIKIDNEVDIDMDIVSLIDPHVTITIIEDEKVSQKIELSLPEKVQGILKCHNPRCVSQIQPDEPVTYYLANEEKREYRCEFCDTKVKM